MRVRRRLGWVLLAYLAVWSFGIARLDRGYVGRIRDDGIYLVTAQSIRDGHGYRLPSRPGDPIARKYPPGFPLALAVTMKLIPGRSDLASDIQSARILVALSAAVFLYLSWLLLIQLKMPPAYALLAVAAISLHPTMIASSSTIMSDTFYSALALAVLLLAISSWRIAARYPAPIFLAGGALAAICFCVRGNGIAVFPALIAQAALLPRRKTAIVASVAGFLLLMVSISIVVGHAHGPADSASYRSELAAVWSTPQAGIWRTMKNLWGLNDALPPILLAVLWSTPAARIYARVPLVAATFNLAVCAVLIVGIVGVARLGLRRYAGLWIFGALSLAIILIWPWDLRDMGPRMMLPLFPLIVIVFLVGFTQVVRAAGLSIAHPARAALAVVTISALASFASYSYRLMRGANPSFVKDQEQLASYIAMAEQGVPQSGVVINGMPELISIYAHRQSVPLLEDDDWLMHRYGRWERIQWWMDAAPDRQFYLVADPSDPQVAALLRDSRMQVDIVERSPDVLVARVTRRPGIKF
jgi:hypothetical protein